MDDREQGRTPGPSLFAIFPSRKRQLLHWQWKARTIALLISGRVGPRPVMLQNTAEALVKITQQLVSYTQVQAAGAMSKAREGWR